MRRHRQIHSRDAIALLLPACGEKVGMRGRFRLAQNGSKAPHPRLRRDLSREGRGERIDMRADNQNRSRGALMRPSSAYDHDAIPKIDSRPATKKEGAERRKAHANHRRHADKCVVCAARLRSGRQRALSGRARLPALCCGTRQGERIRRWLSSSSRVS